MSHFHDSFVSEVGKLDPQLGDRDLLAIVSALEGRIASSLGVAADTLRVDRDQVVAAADDLRNAADGQVHRVIVGFLVLLDFCRASFLNELHAEVNGSFLDFLMQISEQMRGRAKTLPTESRREALNVGLKYIRQGIRMLDEPFVTGRKEDAMKMHVEFGQFLLNHARRTVAEVEIPLEMVEVEDGSPPTKDTVISPDLDAPEYRDGLKLLSRGVEIGARAGFPSNELDRLRGFVSDCLVGLVGMPASDAAQAQSRLVDTLEVTRRTGDYKLFSTAALQLSTLFRRAKRPEVAENVLKKALSWAALQKEQQRDLNAELASTLSEQEKFGESEAIQRQLLDSDF